MRLVIAEDSVLLREGLSRLLHEAGFEVVGKAADGEEVIRLVEETRPDVAIVDIRMPPSYTDEGLRAARDIRAEHPGVGTVEAHVGNIFTKLDLAPSSDDHRRVLAVIRHLGVWSAPAVLDA